MVNSVRRAETEFGRVRRWAAISALTVGTFLSSYLAHGVASAADVPVLQPMRIDPSVPIKAEPVSKDLVVAGSPVLQVGEHVFYVSPDGTMRVGVEEGRGPGKVHLEMSIAEYVYIVEGGVTIRDAAGNAWSLKKGDTFLIPKGFKGEANISRHFRSEFVRVSSGPQKQ